MQIPTTWTTSAVPGYLQDQHLRPGSPGLGAQRPAGLPRPALGSSGGKEQRHHGGGGSGPGVRFAPQLEIVSEASEASSAMTQQPSPDAAPSSSVQARTLACSWQPCNCYSPCSMPSVPHGRHRAGCKEDLSLRHSRVAREGLASCICCMLLSCP